MISTFNLNGGSYYSVDSLSSTTKVPFSIKAGSITASITPESYITSITNAYLFSFTPEHSVPIDGKVIVSYPS
jgi:hypothetical protein